MGPKCTSRAVHERVKNLQKKAKAIFDETSPAYPGGVAATPRKRPARPASETPARKVKKAKSDPKPQEEKKQEQPQEVEKQEQPEENVYVIPMSGPYRGYRALNDIVFRVAKDEPLFEGFD